MPKYKVTRVIEYVGDKEWLERTLEKSFVTSAPFVMPNGNSIVELSCTPLIEVQNERPNDTAESNSYPLGKPNS